MPKKTSIISRIKTASSPEQVGNLINKLSHANPKTLAKARKCAQSRLEYFSALK